MHDDGSVPASVRAQPPSRVGLGTSGREAASDGAASEADAEATGPALPLHQVLLPCLLSFAAWEVARLWRLPAGLASAPLVSSLLRALILLTPAALVAHRAFGERLVPAFWLAAPQRAGLKRSILTGVEYLVIVNGLDMALGNPLGLPALTPGQVALTLFDAAVEEALFRGFLLSHLMRGRRFARANLLAASIFLLPHARKVLDLWISGTRLELMIAVLAIFLMGWVLGIMARPVRSIWISTPVHALVNLFAKV